MPAGWGGGASYSGLAAASPLAGALVGIASGLALVSALAIGLPALPAAVAAAAVGVALSGALHLDGLADVADGFGGGTSLERKLEIMRDPRLGSYGGAALTLAVLARVTLVAGLVPELGGIGAMLAVIAAAALARPLAFLPTLALQSARADGLGHAARPSRLGVLTGFGIAAAAALLLTGLVAGVAAIALAFAAAASITFVAQRQIGGYTGDVCGASAELAEIAALAGLLAAAA